MKKIVAIGLLGVFLLCLLKPIMPYMDYMINYSVISTELCESAGNAFSSCHGKCYLKEKVMATKASDSNSNSGLAKIGIEDYFVSDIRIESTPGIALEIRRNHKLTTHTLIGFRENMLDPPIV